MSKTATNAPSDSFEHQIAFFESHFTEMKSGWQSGASGTSDPLLRWVVSGSTEWNATWEAGVWHNVAYGIDFDAGSVEFYHSTGADDLVLTVPAVSVAASSNGADWHLGMLELPRDGYTFVDEDIYFSGVYIESGDITLSVSGPGGASSPAVSSSAAAPVASSTAAPVVASSSVAPVAVSSSAPVVVASSSAAPIVESTSSIAPVATSAPVASSVEASPSTIATSSAEATPVAPSSAVDVPSATSSNVVAAPTSEPVDDDDDECEYYE